MEYIPKIIDDELNKRMEAWVYNGCRGKNSSGRVLKGLTTGKI